MSPAGGNGGGDSLDALLDDLDCIDSASVLVSSAERGVGGGGSGSGGSANLSNVGSHAQNENSGAQNGGSTRKCFPVCLAGSRDEHGMAPGRGCDTLRCTKCDFEVHLVSKLLSCDLM